MQPVLFTHEPDKAREVAALMIRGSSRSRRVLGRGDVFTTPRSWSCTGPGPGRGELWEAGQAAARVPSELASDSALAGGKSRKRVAFRITNNCVLVPGYRSMLETRVGTTAVVVYRIDIFLKNTIKQNSTKFTYLEDFYRDFRPGKCPRIPLEPRRVAQTEPSRSELSGRHRHCGKQEWFPNEEGASTPARLHALAGRKNEDTI